MPQDILRFQRSITQELFIIKDRVRDLIGPANWGEEGRFKEAILSKMISQFLPGNLIVGTGFIISNEDHQNGNLGSISKQLDILIYDSSIPVVFREGDFVILTEDAVRGVVEVKSKVINFSADASHSLNNIITKLNRLRTFSSFIPAQNIKKKFVGIFSFDYGGNFEDEQVDSALVQSDGLVNHLALGPDRFVRYWSDTNGLVPPTAHLGRAYIKYNIPELAFSYFISNLLHIVSDENPDKRYWFSFPIPGTKELHRIDPIIALPAFP